MPVTFTKLFSSITESTVWCESDQVRIVWITMLAMANKNGYVFGSVPGLANRARVSVEAAREALFKFQQPDIDSRTKEFEGRRIEEVDGGWRLLTYAKHRAIRDEEERRTYMRDLMREKRSVSKVSRSKPPLSQAEAEAEAEASKSKALRTFVRPVLEDVIAYCLGRENVVDPRKWFDYYESNGWRVGRNPMKDWKAAVRTWEKSGFNTGGNNGRKPETFGQLAVGNSRRAAEAVLARSGIPPANGFAFDVQPGTDRGRLRDVEEVPRTLPPAKY